MSLYTTEIRFICETEAGCIESKGYSDVDSILTLAAPKIFNFSFPIFDESYRLPLEKKILRHYYTREISEETVGLWKLRLEDKMNLIMPYYNQLYRSELLEFNPLYDVNLTRLHKGEHGGNESSNNSESEKTNTTNSSDKIENTSSTVETNGKFSNTNTNDSDNTTEQSGTVVNASYMEEKNNSVNTSTAEQRNNSGNESTTSQTNKSTNVSNINTENTEESSDTRASESDKTSNTVSNGNVSETGEKVGTTTENGNNEKWDLYSDTPQGGINGIVNQGSTSPGVTDNTYLTNARKISESEEKSSENVDRNTSTQESKIVGNTNDLISAKESGNQSIKYGGSSDRTDTLAENGVTELSANSFDNTSSEKTDNAFNNRNIEKNDNSSDSKKSESHQSEIGTAYGENSGNTANNSVASSNESGSIESDRNSNSVGVREFNNTDEYLETVVGKQGGLTYSKMLEEFRKTFLNIDEMVINSLGDLFFGLWG